MIKILSLPTIHYEAADDVYQNFARGGNYNAYKYMYKENITVDHKHTAKGQDVLFLFRVVPFGEYPLCPSFTYQVGSAL